MFKYSLYGLIFASELKFGEIVTPYEGEEEEDVKIFLKSVPKGLDRVTGKRPFYEANESELLMTIGEAAKYYIKDGKEIWIDLEDGADLDVVRLFLMGSCMTALLYQRKVWCIHGSCVVKDGEACVFSGISGSGKSTIAAAFQQEGYNVVTEDLCPVSINSKNQLVVYPGYRSLKLWSDAMEKLGVDSYQSKVARKEIEKFYCAINGEFIEAAVPLKSIYLINRRSEQFKISPLEGQEKFNGLAGCTHKPKMLKAKGLALWLFKSLGSFVDRVNVKRLNHERDGDLKSFVKRVIEDFEK